MNPGNSSPDDEQSDHGSLPPALADYLHVTVGHTVKNSVPSFAGNKLTVTAIRNTGRNLGYILGLVVGGDCYKAALLEEIETQNRTLPLPADLYMASRLLLFIYVDEKTDAVTKTSKRAWQSSTLSAVAVNVDWLERLGQTAAIEQMKVNGAHFSGSVFTRHLHYEVDVASLIAAGAAVQYRFHSPGELTAPLSERFKVMMDCNMFDKPFDRSFKEWMQNHENPDSCVSQRYFRLPARPGTVIGLPRGDSRIVEASAFRTLGSETGSWPALDRVVETIESFCATTQVAEDPACPGVGTAAAIQESLQQTPVEQGSSPFEGMQMPGRPNISAVCPRKSFAIAVVEETIRAWDYTYGVPADRLAQIRKAKILRRGLTSWRTTRFKDLGLLTTIPEKAVRPATTFGVLTHMAMKVANYRTEYSDFSGIVCCAVVNVMLFLLHVYG
ncbi:putative transmembrane protein [Gregarina niphandrodes]|uniref:Transmembrane protein n=1 Tax=Gregarina niphandrodes TaxID=110365 RepID=A0A023B1Z0_GRENI|nr:putative transmembrane protein [Gregarina niphandrodes]EZG48584.1 putative transmembrane protein [Gregarina niphandrodes]|eukprot:XP_011132088.1 putative transmembrane protein [Gregarina niphandrodes]